MLLVHLHPGFEKQRSLQRKLTKWWSQLNAKASLEKTVPTKSTALAHMMSFQNQKWHLARFLVGKEEMVWYRIWIMQPTARLSPTRISFVSSNYWAQVSCYWPRTLFSVGNWLVKSLECPHTNRSTPCSYCGHSFSWIPTVAHSRIVYHVDIAIYMPWRLEVALANRQDKVKGHHRSIVHWHEPNCLCAPQFLRLPFTCNLHRFQDTKATTH